MLGILFIYPLFVASCVAGLIRPFWGLVGFYSFVFLEPEWNWRWSIPADSAFQKYIGPCVILGFILHGLPGNRLRGWLGVSIGCLLGFLGLAYISSFQTLDARLTSFYLETIAKVIVMAVITSKLVNSPERAWILLWVMVIGQGYNAYRINEQYFEDGYSLYSYMRSWGRKGDNNLYSIFTIPAMAASLSIAIFATRIWQRWLSGIVLVLQMHQLMLMESRGCMLGALFMFGWALLLMPKNRYTLRMTAFAVIAGAALAGPPVIREFTSSFETGENRDSSAASRFELWRAGAMITWEHPLLGVGPYAGQKLVPEYAPSFAHWERKGVHNLFFELSTGCGLPATLLYFSFLLIPWFIVTTTYWRNFAELGEKANAGFFALSIGVPGYLLSSMFSSGALLESSYLLVAGMAGLAYSTFSQPADVQSEMYNEDR